MSTDHNNDRRRDNTSLKSADFSSHHIDGFANAALESGAALNDAWFDVPLISDIAPNLWMGGVIDGVALPSEIKTLISFYDWEEWDFSNADPDLLRVKWLFADASTVPDPDRLLEIAQLANERRTVGPVLIHCQAGLNRSGLATALTLISDGMSAPDAVALIRERRTPLALCNETFEHFVLNWAEELVANG